MNALEVDHLTVVRDGRVVLADLSFVIAPGSVTGLLGPSGSGKSTLMRAIVGVQRVAGGQVRVLGQPAGSRGIRGRVGYVTQSPSVFGDLTVRENLEYFAAIVAPATVGTDQVVRDVALVEHVDDRVDRLSGGQRARVSLAAALLGDPEVLVLDEPTVGLDPLLREDLWAMFRRLATGGRTLIISSHVMEEADRCDRLLLLRQSRLLADATPAELRRQTGADDLDAAFLHLVRGEAAA